MYPFDLEDGVERYQDMLREAEEHRRAKKFGVRSESLLDLVAKWFDRSGGQTRSTPVGHRPVTSAR